MKHFELFSFWVLLCIFLGCKEEEIKNTPEPIPIEFTSTGYKSLFTDSNYAHPNARAKLYVINDSCFFLCGFGGDSKPHFYKVMYYQNNIIDLTDNGFGYVKDISFVNDSIGYLLMWGKEPISGIGSILYYTADGGKSWEMRQTNIADIFNRIYFSSPDSGMAVNESFQDVYNTTDGGHNWVKNDDKYFRGSSRLSNFFPVPHNRKICFLICSYNRKNHLIYSDDGGFRWILHNNNNIESIRSLYFFNENTGFLSSDDKIYKIDKIDGEYKEIYYIDHDDIIKMEAKNESEVYFSTYLKLYKYTSNSIASPITLANTDSNKAGHVINFTVNIDKGLVIDSKGSIYKAKD